MASEDLSGTTILHYELRERLRQRATSDLYLAVDNKTQQLVFFELAHSYQNQTEPNGRFQRRMETVSQLQHNGIAPIIEIGNTADKRAYAVVEYADDLTLSDLMTDPEFQPTPIEALELVRKMAHILQAGHPAGIFHHDLRPDNIIMCDTKTPLFVDLGVPISTEQASRDKINGMRQLDYSPPEQLDGKPLTGCSNVYSLGVILYQLLAGQQPQLPRSQWDIFERSQLPLEIPLEEAREGLTPITYRVVRTCLWRSEWSRYQTLNDLIAALDAAIHAEKTALETTGQRPLTWRQLIIGAIVFVVLVTIVAGLLLLFGVVG